MTGRVSLYKKPTTADPKHSLMGKISQLNEISSSSVHNNQVAIH